MKGLSYGQKVSTIREVVSLASALEPDAGIRIRKDESSYVFVGKNEAGFIVIEASFKEGKLATEESHTFKNEKELDEYLRGQFREPLDALLY